VRSEHKNCNIAETGKDRASDCLYKVVYEVSISAKKCTAWNDV